MSKGFQGITTDHAAVLYGAKPSATPQPATAGDTKSPPPERDAASILYGGSGKSSGPPPMNADRAEQGEALGRLKRREEGEDAKPAEEGDEKDAASSLYGDKAEKFDATEMKSFMSAMIGNAVKDGHEEKADELAAAQKGLLEDFEANGTPSQIVNDSSKIFAEYTGRQIDDDTAQRFHDEAMGTLTSEWGEHTTANLDAVRQMIRDLDRTVSPGLIASLEGTRAGNDPRLIRLALREAKRRGYLKGGGNV